MYYGLAQVGSGLWYGGNISDEHHVCERCMAMVLRAGMAWSMVPGLVFCLSTLFPWRCSGKLLSSGPPVLTLCHPYPGSRHDFDSSTVQYNITQHKNQ